jgi:hypothetical protein
MMSIGVMSAARINSLGPVSGATAAWEEHNAPLFSLSYALDDLFDASLHLPAL